MGRTMKNNFERVVILVFLIATFSPALLADQRDDSGFYIGGGIGFISIDEGDFDDDNDIPQGFVGWQITPNFGVEAGYADLGSFSDSSASVETDGISLAATLRLPITERFALFGKAGQFWWEADFDVENLSDNFDDTELFYGVGLSFEVTDNIDFRLSYDRLDIDVGRRSIGPYIVNFKGELNILSAGLKLEF